MKLKEHLSIFKRSIKYLYNLDKTYTVTLILNSLLAALIPYIAIYMSAIIIDELLTLKRIPQLITYTTVTVGLTFILKLIQTYIDKIHNCHWDILYKEEENNFSEKNMSLDYELVENRDTQLLRDKIAIESQTGFNLFYLYSRLKSVIDGVTNIITSVIITGTVFLSDLVSVWIKLVFIVAVVLISAINFYINARNHKLNMKYWEECVPENNFSNYLYGHIYDYRSGLECRMYGMEKLYAKKVLDFQNKLAEINYKNQKRLLISTFLEDVMVHLLNIVVYAVIISAAFSGGLTVGEISKYVSATFLIVWSMQSLIKAVQTLLNNNTHLKTYFSYLDIPSKMYKGTLPVESVHSVTTETRNMKLNLKT